MRVMTFKAKPKMIFGIILCVVGIVVIVLTFLGNHQAAPASASDKISGQTERDRAAFLTGCGWEFDGNYTEKEIVIPTEFNDVYTQYNAIQTAQNFDLEPYKGKTATLYTYRITNYKGHENDDYIYADILVSGGYIIGGDICSTDAENGFMHGFYDAKTG